MKQYLQALQDILDNGEVREDRTGVGTKGIFGYQMRFDLADGFPAVTTKRLAWRSVVSELLWFLEGGTDERRLAEILYGTRNIDKKTIWTANADNQGKALGYENHDGIKELGPVYGAQWRDFNAEGYDQIVTLIKDLKENPYSRRHILTAWNPAELDKMALPPCHLMAQFYVSNDNKLSCQMYQRSADMFLGVPFNIASYALLTHIIADLTGLAVGEFIHTIGDAHIYLNHMDQVKEQLTRKPAPLPFLNYTIPVLLNDVLSSKVDEYKLINYNPQANISAPMAV